MAIDAIDAIDAIEGIALRGCGGGSYYMRRRLYFCFMPQKRAIISVF